MALFFGKKERERCERAKTLGNNRTRRLSFVFLGQSSVIPCDYEASHFSSPFLCSVQSGIIHRR